MNIQLTPFDYSQFSRFAHWIDTTPLGAYIYHNEQTWFDTVSADIFGYKAIQLQLPHIDFLRKNRIPWRVALAEEAGGAMQALNHALPLANQSVDLLVLPHVLDFAQHPQHVLREAERILVPEGRLLITGFNPWSLWACRRLGRCDPWQANWLSLPRLKDWLALMGFASMQGSYLGYTFPINHTKWLACGQWINSLGDRWWPAAGAVYCLDMVKRVQGMRMITPSWKKAVSTSHPIVASDVSCKNLKISNDE